MDMKKLSAALATAEESNGFPELTKADLLENRIRYDVAVAIRKRRRALKMSQQELAERMGISQPMISQWESGDYNFTISALAQISEILGLDLKVDMPVKADPCKGFQNQSTTGNDDWNIIQFISEAA